MGWMDEWDVSLTPPTTRAPLAVLKIWKSTRFFANTRTRFEGEGAIGGQQKVSTCHKLCEIFLWKASLIKL